MNVKEIKELVDLVARRGLAGLEIERAGFRIRIDGPARPSPVVARRGAALPGPDPSPLAEIATATMSPIASPVPVMVSLPPAPSPAAAETEGLHVVTSPIVGTFYRAPEPGGGAVREGRRRGREGEDALHRRGDEADERDRGRRGGDDRRRSSRRTASRSSSARSSSRSVQRRGGPLMFQQGPRRQPRGDRAPDHRGLQGARASRRSPSTPRPTATRSTCRSADESVCIGPAAPAGSYLNITSIVAAAEITGADAVHPGYGFLAENAHFAEILGEVGLTWIGPSPEAIRKMGDKAVARDTAKKRGRPDRSREPRAGRVGRRTR